MEGIDNQNWQLLLECMVTVDGIREQMCRPFWCRFLSEPNRVPPARHPPDL